MGAMGWFDLPIKQREEILSSSLSGVDGEAVRRVDQELFREMARVCGGDDPKLADHPKGVEHNSPASPVSTDLVAATVRESDTQSERVLHSPPSTLVHAAVALSARNGNTRGAEETTTSAAVTGPAAGVTSNQETVSVRAPVEVECEAQDADMNSSRTVSASNVEASSTAGQIRGAELMMNRGVIDGWGVVDWRRFIVAWESAANEFVELGNIADEVVKLPSWLIVQEWTRLGGGKELRVDMVHPKKEMALAAYQAVAEFVHHRGIGDWFEVAYDVRQQRQEQLFHDESVSRVLDPPGILACVMDKELFDRLGVVVEKEAILASTRDSARQDTAMDDDDGDDEEDGDGGEGLSPLLEVELSVGGHRKSVRSSKDSVVAPSEICYR